ncbi:MAG: helix-turn-helix domain-containing protein [Pyrinomonadaceae bacterium]
MHPENQLYSDPMAGKTGLAGRPSKKKATESGTRLAALRKQAGLSQAALAEAIGIPQRTISFYEREAAAIPSTLVPRFAKVLGVSMEELLGIGDGAQRAKRGPKSQLERQLEAVATLPRNQQQKILAVVEAMIAHHAER